VITKLAGVRTPELSKYDPFLPIICKSFKQIKHPHFPVFFHVFGVLFVPLRNPLLYPTELRGQRRLLVEENVDFTNSGKVRKPRLTCRFLLFP
jgi:hypothetical protein